MSRLNRERTLFGKSLYIGSPVFFHSKFLQCQILWLYLLMKLRKNASVDTRTTIANNPDTPVEILVQLSRDKDGAVRGLIACNPSTPVKVLAQLGRDENQWIRSRVACNPSTPVKVLAQLSRDEKRWVRNRVVTNPTWLDPKNQQQIKDTIYLIDLGLG